MSNNKKPNYEYTGNYQPPKEIENKNEDYKKKIKIYCPNPYLPSNDLKEAVNLAIKLERPLLLEGEPGCGKTRLAGALAYEFTKKNQEFLQGLPTESPKTGSQETTNQEDDDNIKQWWDYYIWNIKSTTRARDGLYRYDAVARLRDAQLMGTNPDKLQEFIGEEETEKLKERLKDKKNYLEFGALGKALDKKKKEHGSPLILLSNEIDKKEEHGYRPILLIDEIDKADSDFANDLLLELEELRFEIPETGEEIPTPKHKPIIFITSNREKPLPEPFLRRCIYFYVDFPNKEQLEKIINNRLTQQEDNQKVLIRRVMFLFYNIRKLLQENPGSKPPGTSEFIDFINALIEGKDTPKDLLDVDILFKRMGLLGTLIKTEQDLKLIISKKQELIPKFFYASFNELIEESPSEMLNLVEQDPEDFLKNTLLKNRNKNIISLQQILSMRLQNKKLEDISEEFGITLKSISNFISRKEAELKSYITKHMGIEFDE